MTHVKSLLQSKLVKNNFFLNLFFTVNDKVVVLRSCSWEDINAPADSCMRTTTPSYIKTEFCETCGHDGCNGASKFSGVTLLALIPAVIAFVLAL